MVEEKEPSEITTIQLHRKTKNKLDKFKDFLKTDFDKIVNGFMKLIYKFKMKEELKENMKEDE